MPKRGISKTLDLYSASNRLGLVQSALAAKILDRGARVDAITKHANRLLGGHPVVRDNLMAGLSELGEQFRFNPLSFGPEAVRIVLAGKRIAAELLKASQSIHSIGPNFCVTPRESINIFSSPRIQKIIVPSKESAMFFALELPEIAEKLAIWPVGVDHVFWDRDGRSEVKENITVYTKTSDVALIDTTLGNLEKGGFPFEIIHYGRYSKPQFRTILSRSKAVVWLGHFESQGIAQFEAWSMGVPTFVFKTHGDVAFSLPYNDVVGVMPEETWSPSPYLTPTTGAFWRNQAELWGLLQEAENGRVAYQSREFIIQHHTLKKSAEHLLEIIA